MKTKLSAVWCHSKTRMLVILLGSWCATGAFCSAETVTVVPEKAVIVSPAKTNSATADAVRELAKHLKLLTGKEVPVVGPTEPVDGKYAFHVGTRVPGDDKPLVLDEARYVVTPTAAYFYGYDEGVGRGTQFAVYDFLDQQCGVRWIEPGDVGICYTPQNPLKLETTRSDWKPKLMFRYLRQGVRKNTSLTVEGLEKRGLGEFKEFLTPVEKDNAFVDDVLMWRFRLRMGGERPGGGHTFSTWWPLYGKTHPEYFALVQGKREPVTLRGKTRQQTEEFVKICASNPGVVDQVIQDWLPRKAYDHYVGANVNDGGENWCECPSCRALDVTKPGEKWQDHLTDRYIYLANAVARKVREIDPNAWVTSYAYLNTLEPPRKIRVEPNIIVQLVPYTTPLDTESIEALFKGWHDAGATKLALRPNFHTKYNTGVIPIGHEKQVFDVFQMAVKYGAISADYDSLVHHWSVTGIADYILARAMAEPEKSFTHWEDEYSRTYGPAADVAKRYFRHWREDVWEKRLYPNIGKITTTGGAGDFVRGLMWSLGDYYKPADFDKPAAILKEADGMKLSTGEKDRLNQLVLANQHARLVYDAVVAKGMAKSGPAQRLLQFRGEHQHDLRLPMLSLCANEIGMGDITGLELMQTASEYLPPWIDTDVVWRFRLDPQNTGLDQKWQEKNWEQTADWDRIRTNEFWENQADDEKLLSADTRAKLKGYDGIAWYSSEFQVPTEFKGRRIFLRFGSVDESCWVYVNGKLAGQHIYQKANDWKTPFEIEVGSHVDWSKPNQVVTVRVEDKAGLGGIWRPVSLVSKK